MKKVILLFSLTAVLAVFPVFVAVAADVYSANIVGFHRLQLSYGHNLIGLNFRNNSDQIYFNVQDLFDTSSLQGGETIADADRLFLWDRAAGRYIELWLLDSGTGHDWDGKWWNPKAGVEGELAEEDVYPGDAFFLIIQKPNDPDQEPPELILSGEVQDNVEIFTHAALGGRSMISSAWPVDIEVNEMVLDGLQGGETLADADRLFLWDADDQKYIELWLLDSGTGHELDGKWWDPEAGVEGELAQQVLTAGSGAFIIRDKDAVDPFTEEKPY